LSQRFQGIAELADKVAAYAAIEEFLDAGDSLRGCELRIDRDVAKFILQKRKAVGRWQL